MELAHRAAVGTAMKLSPIPLLALALLGCSPRQSPPADPDNVGQTVEDLQAGDPAANEAAPLPAKAGPLLYKAVGNEPGWSLSVGRDRMDYLGNYGEVRISEPTPAGFRPAPGRYAGTRLKLAVSEGPCSDGMSDLVYRHTVRISADGEEFSGCGGGTVAPDRLAGTSWTVVAINGRKTPGGANYFLQFGNDTLSAKFGCNSMGGAFRQNGDHLSVPQIEQTLMGCPEPSATFESQASAILANARVERISGTRARLVSEAGEIDLVRAI